MKVLKEIQRVQSIESTKLYLPLPRAWDQREMCRIVQDPVEDAVGDLHTHILCGNLLLFVPLTGFPCIYEVLSLNFYEIYGACYFYLI